MARAPVTHPVDALTPREREVARLMARGLTNPQIAEELGIGFGTAKTHVSQVIAKLGVTTREEATTEWRREQSFGRRMHRGMAGLLAFAGWKAVALAALAGLVALPVAALLMTARGQDSEPVDGAPAFADAWERLPDPPIEPRVRVVSVWTGREALFVGGHTLACAPIWRCPMTSGHLPTDGAAFDPETEVWRTIAEAPFGFSGASTAVVQDSVYFLVQPAAGEQTGSTLLQYSIENDEWTEVEGTAAFMQERALAATADGRLVVYRSNGQLQGVDYIYDPAANSWSTLPADPFSDGFDREMHALDGSLYLLDYAPEDGAVPIPPTAVRLARFTPGDRAWQVLPSTESFNIAATYAGEGLLVNPGGPNDRPWPAIFDVVAGLWRDLPAMPVPQGAGGVLGRNSGRVISPNGVFFDAVSETWVEAPDLPVSWPASIGRHEALQTFRNSMIAGNDIMQYGGLSWGDSRAEQIKETWILRFHRTDTDERNKAGEKADHWERLPDPPIPPRSNVVAVWTGEEALFVGGDTFLCPPLANCFAPAEPPLADGAAYDPSTNSWRRIADAPVRFAWASTAVLDGSVYFLISQHQNTDATFLRYEVATDSWEILAMLPREPSYHRLVATDAALVAYASTHEVGSFRDFAFDPRTREWTELPTDPLSPAFDRSMVWADGALYLFDQPVVAQPGSAEPSLTRVARLDFDSGRWERLADSEILGSGPWFADRALLVNPRSGGADGGQVNNWGREYPYGGIFDTLANAWLPLPPGPASEFSAGVLGETSALFFGVEGTYLDLDTATWHELPDLPDSVDYERRNVLTAGSDIIAFGGERWRVGNAGPGEILTDAWIWRSGR